MNEQAVVNKVHPKDAQWLSAEERATLLDVLARERREHAGHDKTALKHAFASVHTRTVSVGSRAPPGDTYRLTRVAWCWLVLVRGGGGP